MKSIKNKIYCALGFMLLGLVKVAYSAPTLMPKTPEKGAAFDTNYFLVAIATILIIPIFLLGRTLVFTIKLFIEKEKKKTGEKGLKTVMILLAFVTSNELLAQQTEKIATPSYSILTPENILIAAIAVEVLVIIFFGIYILSLLKKIQQTEEVVATKVASEFWFTKWWKKSNNFIPIEEEDKLDTGHSYDGIRELDNVIPPWFSAAFVICIFFAIVYLWRYHVAESAPLQIEEYKNEMAIAAKEKEEYLKNAANNIDENNVVMLDKDGIEAGKGIFEANCVSCHGANGASMMGGVGPNLTDAYWLHGGSLKEVFTTIKYGWPDKGMRSWKDQLNPKQMAQVASYVKSISTSNIKGKDPQGVLYAEAIKVDTNHIAKDTATKK